MKHLWKKAAALVLCLAVVFSLSGCGQLSQLIRSGFDATGYVRGILDCTYKAQFEEYCKLTDATAEEAQDSYDGGIQAEANTFMNMCGFDTDLVSDQMAERVEDFYRRVYQKSNYEVKEAVKSDNGFYVEVVIYPIDIFQLAWDDMKAFANDFNQRTEDGEFEEYSQEDFEEAYDLGMIEICEGYEDQIGYLDPVSVVVTVSADEDGVYNISQDDFIRLDEKIIQYN